MKIINPNLSAIAILTLISFGCSAQQNNSERPNHRQNRPPSIEELFEKLDLNADNQLSVEEVKGPLTKDFLKIDVNGNGFISKEELENAPKPERRERPRENRQ